MPPAQVLVVTGASGAGKTSAVRALEARGIDGVRCFYFDSIGVPSPEVMQRDFGGGEQWQAHVTREWLTLIGRLSDDVRVAVLDGQTRPSFVLDASACVRTRVLRVVLLDCSNDTRQERLRGPRGQPELATDRMTTWAAYLRGQADALRLPIIDTTHRAIARVADDLEQLIATTPRIVQES